MPAPKDKNSVKYKEYIENLKRGQKKRFEDPEQRRKQSHKGQVTWNKGLTKETDRRVRKMSESNEGKKRSKETRRKQSENTKKHMEDPERIKIQSENTKKQMEDPEQRRKQSKSHIKENLSEETLKKMSESHIGKNYSKESNEKKRQSMRKFIQENRMITHHIDEDRNNNDPTNLQDVYWRVHRRIHRMRDCIRKKYKTELIFV